MITTLTKKEIENLIIEVVQRENFKISKTIQDLNIRFNDMDRMLRDIVIKQTEPEIE